LSTTSRTFSIRDLPPPNADLNPIVPRVRKLCEDGKADAAAVLAFEAVFSDTIRLYGLRVPPSCTSLEFLSQFLRPDMGKLCDLLPELYRLYEPARFGGILPPDPASVRTIVERIYSETALAWAYDPLYQPKGPTLPPLLREVNPVPSSPSGAPKRT
jgi:hypothetical protein